MSPRSRCYHRPTATLTLRLKINRDWEDLLPSIDWAMETNLLTTDEAAKIITEAVLTGAKWQDQK